ncbi:MAG: Rpn family recombination-promoting nuclease/putative transposase, partial [Eubacteriales bacterium]|nr:Rpn family recombination-promoting nuclease/putative transposase [Eubacteriales bacterium]
MGRKNDAIVDFLGRDEVLADLYNGCLYNGEQVILPELLGDVQRTYHESLKNRYLKKSRRRRERDVLKLFQDKEHLILLAVEAQNNPHLCMPLKCLEYDVDEYVRQLRHLSRRYRENGELTEPTEKLSGIRRTDRLNPVVTIVLYHGEDDWTAPTHLQEMLDMSDMRPEMKNFCADYNIHLFKLSDLNEKNFHTGLRELIGIMKRRNDKGAILSYYEENRERFRQMDD